MARLHPRRRNRLESEDTVSINHARRELSRGDARQQPPLEILAHLEKYEYASIEHVAVAPLLPTMMRVGGVHLLLYLLIGL